MKVYEYSPAMKLSGKRVIALGFFDGVHLGHRKILKEAALAAREASIPAAVFTFKSESAGLKGEKRIYTTKEKIDLISECGIDEVIVAEFSELCTLDAEVFVRDVLVLGLGAHIAVCGEDFRFGHGAKGDTGMLLELMKSLGGGLICPKDVMLSGEKISSTRVKTLLKEGRVKEAGELLGRAYSVKKQIRHGLGLGKSFGFPTVNTDICESDPALAFGVYKCLTKIDGVTYNSLTNVGTCPTVGKREGHRETFIVGFDGDLYGKEIEIYFLDFVRGEKRFESVEELIMQIKDDIKTCFESEE